MYNLEVGDGYSWLIKRAQIGKFYITTPSFGALTGGLVRLVNTWTLIFFLMLCYSSAHLGYNRFVAVVEAS